MPNKFIINNGQFLMGDVEYHKDLAKDHKTTRGGGLFYVDEDQKILYLYDESGDFGRAAPENITNAIHNTDLPLLKGYSVKYSKMYSLSVVFTNNTTLIESI